MPEDFSIEEIYRPTPLRDSPSQRFWFKKKQKKAAQNYKKRKNKKKQTHHIDIYV